MFEERPVTLGDWLDLREDLRAAELLLEDLQFSPLEIERYWSMSADLLALLQEVDEHLERWRAHGPGSDEGAVYLAYRRRVVALQAATEAIRQDGGES